MAWHLRFASKRRPARPRGTSQAAGIGANVLVHRLDTVLARTDPFELAQALERYVRAMAPKRIRRVVIDARDRIGAYYRSEFIALLAEFGAVERAPSDELSSEEFVRVVRKAGDGEAMQRALSRLLKSNLRAIPLFGPAFTQGVLAGVPSDRAVAIGEEARGTRMRTAVLGGIALALLLAGAAGEHVISTVRAQNSVASPLPQLPSTVVSVSTPQPADTKHVRTPAPRPSLQQRPQPPQAVAAVGPSPIPAASPVAAPPPVVRQTQAPPRNKRTPAPAQGVATIAVPNPTPTPEPSALDVSDMPDVFTDATPLPSQSPAAAQVPNGVSLKTPTPAPKHKSWLKRTISHLNPFKP